MAFYHMRELPHLVKPVTLILTILQTIFMFAAGYRGFGWFIYTTTIIELIVCTVVFTVVGGDAELVNMPMWPMAELTYSGVFVVFQIIDFFYFLVNMFSHFNAWLLFASFESAFLTIVWLFNTYQWFRSRTPATAAAGNQATAAPPPNFPPNFAPGANPA
ncbi:hypothetical protein Q1695_013486 [Nippostrongylus brasiliensis]|nr:hypothetical protein Q1695_013486 [Nippostrongylus brasiliensis]